MKIRSKDQITYSGNLSTRDLDLGSLLDIPRLGALTFAGKITGSGLQAANLTADLKGDIEEVFTRTIKEAGSSSAFRSSEM